MEEGWRTDEGAGGRRVDAGAVGGRVDAGAGGGRVDAGAGVGRVDAGAGVGHVDAGAGREDSDGRVADNASDSTAFCPKMAEITSTITFRNEDQLIAFSHRLSFLPGPCLKLTDPGSFIPGFQDLMSAKLIWSSHFSLSNFLVFSPKSLASTFISHSTHSPSPLFCYGQH